MLGFFVIVKNSVYLTDNRLLENSLSSRIVSRESTKSRTFFFYRTVYRPFASREQSLREFVKLNFKKVKQKNFSHDVRMNCEVFLRAAKLNEVYAM